MVIDTIGFDKCIANFRLRADSKEAVKTAINKACTMVQGRAKKYWAPRRSWDLPKDQGRPVTGRLKGDIFVDMEKYTSDRQIAGAVISPTEYSVYQEFGTSKMKARPFLRTSLVENKGKIIELISSVVKKKIEAK